jgi:hypothetical protein
VPLPVRTHLPELSVCGRPGRLRDAARGCLDDSNIAFVASAGVKADRAALDIEVMRAGKDFMSDTTAFISPILPSFLNASMKLKATLLSKWLQQPECF